MIQYYNRAGSPISREEFTALSVNPDYKVLFADHFPGWLVSTVWLGLETRFSEEGPPIIFETMIFIEYEDGSSDFDDVYCDRYATEEQARDGHVRALAWLLAKVESGEDEILGR